MYDATGDQYCYGGTTVLKNIAGLREQAALDDFEKHMTAQRSEEPFPPGRLSVSHYRAIHHHLFQDVYPRAGRYRTVRMSKDGSAFCYPEHISREMDRLFGGLKGQRYLRGLPKDVSADAGAEFLGTLNAIRPFREGNGRTQTAFVALLADRAGHPLDFDRLDPHEFLGAMIASFHGDNRMLARQLLLLLGTLHARTALGFSGGCDHRTARGSKRATGRVKRAFREKQCIATPAAYR